jgi:hypothetical protein
MKILLILIKRIFFDYNYFLLLFKTKIVFNSML